MSIYVFLFAVPDNLFETIEGLLYAASGLRN